MQRESMESPPLLRLMQPQLRQALTDDPSAGNDVVVVYRHRYPLLDQFGGWMRVTLHSAEASARRSSIVYGPTGVATSTTACVLVTSAGPHERDRVNGPPIDYYREVQMSTVRATGVPDRSDRSAGAHLVAFVHEHFAEVEVIRLCAVGVRDAHVDITQRLRGALCERSHGLRNAGCARHSALGPGSFRDIQPRVVSRGFGPL